MKNKIKRIINKYYPDILILGGIYVFSYFLFLEPTNPFSIDLINYHVSEKVVGIMLISIGTNIVIRRYF